MIIAIVVMYFSIDAISKGKQITLRKIPALDAIDDAVGRAAELGRPLLFTPGFSLGGLYNPSYGPGVLAGLSILKKVADSAVERGVRIIVALAQAESIPIAEGILKFSYLKVNEEVPPNTVRFISTEQYAYVAGVLGIMREERPAANILMGYFWSEAMQFAEAGSYIGAMAIGGTNAAFQIPFFIAACDYCLMGEELFAAKGYIDRDADQLGGLFTNDVLRIIAIALLVVSWIASNLQLTGILNLLNM
jgi:hypothetical protein